MEREKIKCFRFVNFSRILTDFCDKTQTKRDSTDGMWIKENNIHQAFYIECQSYSE